MKRSFTFLSFLILFASLAMANTLSPVGAPITVGSWTQQFQENGVGPFGEMLFMMNTPGVTFGDPGNPTGINGFNPNIGAASDWGSNLLNSGTTIDAYNNNWGGEAFWPTNMTFFLTFSSDPSVPFSFNFYAYDGWKPQGQQLVDNVTASWDGRGNWTIAAPAATPEPASLALLGSGLLGLAGFVRRKLQ